MQGILTGRLFASVLAMLNYMEQVKRVGKTGNAYIYDIEEHY